MQEGFLLVMVQLNNVPVKEMLVLCVSVMQLFTSPS